MEGTRPAPAPSPLEGERLAVYSAAFPQLGEGQPVAAVFATDSGERVEHLVLVKGSRCGRRLDLVLVGGGPSHSATPEQAVFKRSFAPPTPSGKVSFWGGPKFSVQSTRRKISGLWRGWSPGYLPIF